MNGFGLSGVGWAAGVGVWGYGQIHFQKSIANPTLIIVDALSPGLHHLCLRVDTPADVAAVAAQLRGAGIAATEAKLYPVYAPDYWATYFTDPGGNRLAVTNYRQERRERHDNW